MRVGRGDADGVIFTKDGARGGFPLGRHGLAVTGASQPGLARVPARPAGGGNERSPSGVGHTPACRAPPAATSRADGVPGAVSLGGSHLRLHCHGPLTSNRQHPRPRGASAGQPSGRQFPSRRRRDPGRLPLVPRLSQAFRRRVSSHRPFKTSSVVRPAAGTCHLRCERSTSIPMSETEGMS